MGLAEKNMAPFEQGALVNHHENLIDALSMPVVSAVSVNEISTSTEKIKFIFRKIQSRH